VARDAVSMIMEKHVPVALVVPPRKNLLNSLPEMDVLVLASGASLRQRRGADLLRLTYARNLEKNFSRVGVFYPAGEIGVNHRNLPLSGNR
jgi:hypothetical protein